MNRMLRDRLKAYAPIILDGDAECSVRVLERSSRFAVGLNSSDLEHQQHEVLCRLEHTLHRALESDSGPRFKVWIHTRHDQLEAEHAAAAVVSLCHAFAGGLPPKLVVYADQAGGDWRTIRAFTRFVRQNIVGPNGASVILSAPFDGASGQVIDDMLHLGIFVKIAAGWLPGRAQNGVFSIDRSVLKKISQRGVRAVIEWFVHARNMEAFERCIGELLVANHHSGFSAPLVSQSPFYCFEEDQPPLPEPIDYARFLVRVYQMHGHFDDVLEPLNSLATSIIDGAWNYKSNVANEVSLLLQGGRIALFKRSPRFSVDWVSCEEVATTAPEAVKKDLLAFASEAFGWEKFPYCSECEWRYTCGGHGANEALGATDKVMDVLCLHRKLFLNHFARTRRLDELPPATTSLKRTEPDENGEERRSC